jgi:hypothetical protein
MVHVSAEIQPEELTGCMTRDCCSVHGIHLPNGLAGEPTLRKKAFVSSSQLSLKNEDLLTSNRRSLLDSWP